MRDYKMIVEQFGPVYDLVGFANGGDQTNEICPEKTVCVEFKIQLIDDLGDKIQSRSWLIKK